MLKFKSNSLATPLKIIILQASFILLLSFSLTAPSSDFLTHFKLKSPNATLTDPSDGCRDLHNQPDSPSKCAYVKSHPGCNSGGYIPYLHLFYCSFQSRGGAVLGYTTFLTWLVLLFYLLGNTAANYFCSSLQGISSLLNLSPTVAGITLLSLGNGAPDLFSSLASFMGQGVSEQVGLNSILGGAFFVSSVVVGIISIYVERNRVSIDGSSLRRDVMFFVVSLACLLIIIAVGEITLWGALSFLGLYFVYVAFVACSHLRNVTPDGKSWSGYLETPLLVSIPDSLKASFEERKPKKWFVNLCSICKWVLLVLELPLYLPRRLTIPIVSEDEWSKPFAVLSATISPMVLAFLSTSYFPDSTSLVIYTVGGSTGLVLGTIATFATESSRPPRMCLLPWLAGGFLMSVAWTYILAEELVSLLVSLGLVFDISASILGLTVLAWGNSLGDLVANVTMATNGGREGTQIAISGCYAGALFNVVVGLGLSFVFSAWAIYPARYVIPSEPYIVETIGFLGGGLVFGLAVLSRKGMKLDRYLGGGLLALYLCFLFLRIVRAFGLVQISL